MDSAAPGFVTAMAAAFAACRMHSLRVSPLISPGMKEEKPGSGKIAARPEIGTSMDAFDDNFLCNDNLQIMYQTVQIMPFFFQMFND